MKTKQLKLDNGSLVQIRNYSFAYENLEKPQLNDLHFDINKNEATLLMGASGSGKSTLALCINGLYPEAVEGYSKGDIFFKGRNILNFQKGELNQQIGIVFQDPESQFCMIKVEDELAFTLENLSVPASDMQSKIDDVLRRVGMLDYKQHKIHELSGGQKQKIVLASVLLLEPELLILDEPTANMDPLSSYEFTQLIGNIQKESGISILIIEHQADDWLYLLDRVLVMGRDGQIKVDDQPDSVFIKHSSLLEDEGIFLPKAYAPPSLKMGGKEVQTEPCLSISNLSFQRRKQPPVLSDIDMAFHKGELVAIVGENGAGKSTLLQLMSGLLQPTSGKVTLFEKPLPQWKENELRRRIGFVFQNPEHQFITDTVFDELVFGMKLNGYSSDKINEKAETLMQHFHLQRHKWSNPFSLSGGQKRRLSVATMLDETPDLLLFDEPTFGQDAQTTEELMNIILDLKLNGTGVVFVTHDMDLVDRYCDRVYVLHNHAVAFHGTPKQLWQHEAIIRDARLRLPYRLREEERNRAKHHLVY